VVTAGATSRWWEGPKLTARPDKATYVGEMAAAAAAVAVFIAVYAVGFTQAGALTTLLFAWIPAGVLAWLTARTLRAAIQVVTEMAPSRGLAAGGDDGLAPATRMPRRRSRVD